MNVLFLSLLILEGYILYYCFLLFCHMLYVQYEVGVCIFHVIDPYA
jgi:hypothetical protein